jgi:tetratricopeptide (TPR) repeat protein
LAQAAADEPLLGMRYGALAWALLLQGRLDEANQAEERADEILRSNPEPQAEVLNAATNGYLALASGDDDQAIEQLRRSVQIMRDFNVELIPRAFAEIVRIHLRRDEREPAVAYRDLSERTRSPRGHANARLIDGLLADDEVEAMQALNEAAERFEQIGDPIGRARALIDMGRAQRRAGDDPSPTFELARDVLRECGAGLYLTEAETELAREPSG